MLHMLRAGSANQAEQCGLRHQLVRYLVMMKILMGNFFFLLLISVSAQAQARSPAEPARSTPAVSKASTAQVSESHKVAGQKDSGIDLRAKRGTDLRLALMPQNPSSNPSAALKPLVGLSNVADVATPDLSPEYHLNAKERQEIRELLRQQRLKIQQERNSN